MSNAPEKQETAQPSPSRRSSQQRNRQRSVVFYITILFAAAFLLLLLSFAMERRQTEDMDDLNQSMAGLKDSVSAMQSVQQLYEENAALLEQVNALQEEIGRLEEEKDALMDSIDTLNGDKDGLARQTQALDWFWQINEAYVRGRWSTARDLVAQLRASGLESCLPTVSITDNGRFSPADRYIEICHDIF